MSTSNFNVAVREPSVSVLLAAERTAMNSATTMSAAEYIGTLFASDDLICIMTLRKGEKPKHIFATIEDATSTKFMNALRKQNEAGYDIYICMNPLIAKRRVKENVDTTRTLYIDIDKNGVAALNKISQSTLVPKPHFILQSSPNKFYVIWMVDGIQPADQERLLAALIQEFDGDPAASDCTRVLRLPGFMNHKYDTKPVVEIIESNFDGTSYTAADFKVKIAPFKIAEKTPAVIKEGDRNKRLASLAGKLRHDGFNEDEILSALQIANRRCISPLPDSEVAAIAGSISKYSPAKPAEPSRVEVNDPDKLMVTPESGTSPTDIYTPVVNPTLVQPDMPEARMNLLSLAEVEEEIQRWLWDSRIPLGALTNLSGVADKGKSLVLYDVCARISNGSDFPDGAKNPFQGKPKKVLLLFSEGSLKTTVKPRMMVMGANMANVLTVKSVSRKGETDPDKRQFYLDQDLGRLRQVLRENPDIVLIGFDPLTNYLGDGCNMNLSRDVRKVLTPLGELAEEFGVTVVAIIHFNKNDATNAIYRTGGAAALIEVPRAAWCCVDDDDPERKGGFIFVRIKNNLGKRVGGICYRIEETFISIKGEQASQPRLIWGDASDKTADDLLNLPQHKDENEVGVVQAMHWLENIFKDNFARRSAAVHQLAEADGITEDCLKKARLKLQMQTKKISDRWLMRRRQSKDLPWAVSTDIQQRLDAMETPAHAEPSMAEVVAEGANSAEEVF
jgi:hypothetical protein